MNSHQHVFTRCAAVPHHHCAQTVLVGFIISGAFRVVVSFFMFFDNACVWRVRMQPQNPPPQGTLTLREMQSSLILLFSFFVQCNAAAHHPPPMNAAHVVHHPPPPAAPHPGPSPPQHPPIYPPLLVGDVFAAVVAEATTLLSQLEIDEFFLLLMTIFPLCYGFVAALRSLSGRRASSLDGELAEFSMRTEAALSISESNVQATVERVEQQIEALQRTHETRFMDLHKDLAGIVWELSKLRADMARWQALAQLGGRGSPR